MHFTPNLSFMEIFWRYAGLMVIGILVGVTGIIWFAPLAIAVFVTAITGWCPLCEKLGINHAVDNGETRS